MLETENYSYEEWYLIFLHELTHQKKHDLWYKMFLQIIRDVYWFCIPMLWVPKMENIDMECVCDATVTKYMRSDTTERLLQCYFESGFKTNEKRIVWRLFRWYQKQRDTGKNDFTVMCFSKEKNFEYISHFSFWNELFLSFRKCK